MKLVQRRAVLGIAALALTLGGVTTAHAVPVNKCAAAKTKCVSAKVKGLLGCHQKAEGKSLAVDPTCIDKVVAKFSACIVKPEAKPPCLTTNDGATLEAAIDAYVLDVVQELDPGYPTPVTNKCSVAKKKAVAAKTAAKLGCLAKAFGKEPGTIDPACITKAETKFAGAWAKAEAKPPCLTTGDEVALETKVDVFYSSTSGMLGVVLCGNGINDAGEACDASAPSSGWAQCGPEFTCTACNCACPTTVTFAGDAGAPESILDTGWTGISHRAPIISDGDVTVNLSCAATSRPCGTCAVSGPIANPSRAGQLDEPALHAATPPSSARTHPAAPAAACTGLGTLSSSTSARTLPLAAGGVTTCVVNQFNGPVTGTANVETGEAATTALLTSRVYNGLAIDNPCPRCIGDATHQRRRRRAAPATAARVNGLACDANGAVAGSSRLRPHQPRLPAESGGHHRDLADRSHATRPIRSRKTLTASSPNCTGAAGREVPLRHVQQRQRDAVRRQRRLSRSAGPDRSDLRRHGAASPAPTTARLHRQLGMSGRRLLPGPASRPSRAAASTTRDAGTVLECSDTPTVIGEGECTIGPIDQTCSVASGHAQRGCTIDADCGGGAGSCESPQPPVLPDRRLRRGQRTGTDTLHRRRHGRHADGRRVEPDARRGLLRRSDGCLGRQQRGRSSRLRPRDHQGHGGRSSVADATHRVGPATGPDRTAKPRRLFDARGLKNEIDGAERSDAPPRARGRKQVAQKGSDARREGANAEA